MAKHTTINNALAVAINNLIVDSLDAGSGNGLFRVYSGTQPESPDVAISDQTLLAEFDLDDPAFGAASDDTPHAIATAAAVASTVGLANGTATWFRATDSDEVAKIDGTVGTSDADAIINTTDIVVDGTVELSSWVFRVLEFSS